MIKTLLKSMRQYKKVSWATIFFSAFEVVFEIVIPLCMSGLIDNGIEGGVISMIWKYGLPCGVPDGDGNACGVPRIARVRRIRRESAQ